MKTYVLIISRYFPAKHPRAGGVTKFFDKIYFHEKIHTIRANYDLWKKRIDEVNKGNAVISVRQWTGKPYNSKQEEKFQLSKNQVGCQMIYFLGGNIFDPIIDNSIEKSLIEISVNDGLILQDFMDWFKKYDLSKPMAIIHFTDFRYDHN